jgi:hypothetical protein
MTLSKMSALIAALGLSMLVVSGCGKKDAQAGDKAGTPESGGAALDPGQEFLLKSAQERVEEIKATITKSDFDASVPCTTVKAALGELASVKNAKVDAFRPEAEKLCGLEAWIVYANLILPKIEADRAEDPRVPSISCVKLGLALEGIDSAHASEPRVAELKKKQGQLCPE